MKYTVDYAGEAVEVEVSALGAGRYRIQVGDGKARTVDADVDGGLVHLLDGTASRAVLIGDRGDGAHAQLAGLDAPLAVLDARAARRRARGGGGPGSGADVVRSPMPGRVVDVLVAEGDTVRAGQGVAIVEAMKMENELRAEIDGVVARVHVAAGDRVDGNAELVTLKAEEAGA